MIWKTEETQKLIELYPDTELQLLTVILGHNEAQIRNKVAYLGLRRSSAFKSEKAISTQSRRRSKHVQDSEIKASLENTRDYQKTSLALGVSVAILVSRNSKKYHVQMSPWTPEKIELLKALFPQSKDKDIAATLGVPLRAVQKHARRLGLRKAPEHIERVNLENAQNISSGASRYQWTTETALRISRRGPAHPRWISDRSKIKGRRRSQHRFSSATKALAEKEQIGYCNRCDLPVAGRKEFDHIIPVALGGSNDRTNCQMLCPECHRVKTSAEQALTHNYQIKYRPLLDLQESYTFVARTIE